MAEKKCCIESCFSCTTREEDVGVTYHKFPKDIILCNKWTTVTQSKHTDLTITAYVCSRHFRKTDFQIYKDNKYVLKSDAIPSIFPWTMSDIEQQKMEEDISKISDESNEILELNSKENDGDNLDAIKRFIEEQEKEIRELQKDIKAKEELKKEPLTKEVAEVVNENDEVKNEETKDETMAVAFSMMDVILSESEAQIANKKITKPMKQKSSPDKGSVPLSVGSKVEAKDFSEDWFPADILEVDYDEMEVLVHYQNPSKKPDEWISVSSPRLRPMGSSSKPQSPVPKEESTAVVETPIKQEHKPDEKAKLQFLVGERCLARWRDNRRFIATVHKDLGDGNFEIIFDDGFHWTCKITRLCKFKQSDFSDVTSPASFSAADRYGAGPSNAETPPVNTVSAYHTHLFDPTRDYLGSKSERREKKRKLNIKEIFNIGQKKFKKQTTPDEKPAKKVVQKPVVQNKQVVQKKLMLKSEEVKVKAEVPDAVASIIGTDINTKIDTNECKIETNVKEESVPELVVDKQDENVEQHTVKTTDESEESKLINEPDESKVIDETEDDKEIKIEEFEIHEDVDIEVMNRMKEVINSLEDNICKVETVASPKPKIELDSEVKQLEVQKQVSTVNEVTTDNLVSDAVVPSSSEDATKKNLSKMKKTKKLRLLREKKVKKQVEKVKSELEAMKRQVEEMRQQMLIKSEEMKAPPKEMPESFLLPGEWCCKWVNNQPVGTVSELEAEVKPFGNAGGLPRRSVQVEDKRLPPGWTKHMVRRSLGSSAGKWDCVLVSPENKRFHTKNDMRYFLEQTKDESLKPYEYALLDFGIHLKLARRMGWVSNDDSAQDTEVVPVPLSQLDNSSPLVKRKPLKLKKKGDIMKAKRRQLMRMKKSSNVDQEYAVEPECPIEQTLDGSTLEDGYVYVGSLKVQIIENLLRCPAEGCFKNFRNNTLIKMHIKHYHRELRKMLGATPKVVDLASARTKPTELEMKRLKCEAETRIIKVKLPKLKTKSDVKGVTPELRVQLTPIPQAKEDLPRPQDSPKLRNALANKPVKRPRVLLPVRRPELNESMASDSNTNDSQYEPMDTIPGIESLDFETAISTHTVTKPPEMRKKFDKKKSFATVSKASEDEEWCANNSDVDTRSSYPGSGTPDSKTDMKAEMTNQLVSSESNEEQKEPVMYTYNESGERIKIVHMRREEIINCHCGIREEDGLMVQCELCLCWQHALCHNIASESEVPEKYTCSICLNPRRGRRSQRFLHDQDRLYEGLLPGARPCDTLRRSHELSGNLLRIDDALHALRVKYYVAYKKNHPKLYLWAKDWENLEINMTQEKLHSDYSDLNIMISDIGKENLPIKTEELRNISLDIGTPPSEENEGERFTQRDPQFGSQSLLSGLLSSPGGATLDLPISTSELERLAKTVQEQEAQLTNVIVPQPEAAIENEACRERLLKHIHRCQALIDARLDSIEAQVAELESQDPSFEDDETADYIPRTKQTIQMLMRDLDTMEELGVIT